MTCGGQFLKDISEPYGRKHMPTPWSLDFIIYNCYVSFSLYKWGN